MLTDVEWIQIEIDKCKCTRRSYVWQTAFLSVCFASTFILFFLTLCTHETHNRVHDYFCLVRACMSLILGEGNLKGSFL